jgi:hypothetical protein
MRRRQSPGPPQASLAEPLALIPENDPAIGIIHALWACVEQTARHASETSQ